MGTTVEITQNDDGTYSVGICDSPSSDADDTQQVPDINKALQMAKQILTSPAPAASADQATTGAQAAPTGDASGDPNQGAGGASAQDIWNQMAQGTPQH